MTYSFPPFLFLAMKTHSSTGVTQMEIALQNVVSRTDDEKQIFTHVEFVCFTSDGEWMASVSLSPFIFFLPCVLSFFLLSSFFFSFLPSKVDRRESTSKSPEELTLKFWKFDASTQRHASSV